MAQKPSRARAASAGSGWRLGFKKAGNRLRAWHAAKATHRPELHPVTLRVRVQKVNGLSLQAIPLFVSRSSTIVWPPGRDISEEGKTCDATK